MNKKLAVLFLAVLLLLSGCGISPSGSGTAAPAASPSAAPAVTADPTVEPVPADPASEPTPAATESDPPAATEEPGQALYEFNPHLYVPILTSDIPEDYWESFHNLCDALRKGESTFACSSEDAYKWATDSTVLALLFPAACTRVKGESSDGSASFENGMGKITYQMPAEEYVERQAKFETLIEDILNTCLEPDDDEFEKSLKLFDYMTANFVYEYDFVEQKTDWYVYCALMIGRGQCIDLSGVYAYLLLQSGVEAVSVGGYGPGMDHEWTYLIIGGKGYYSDPTWALRSEGDPLGLYYFLMSKERRANDGFEMDDLTAGLLPRFWLEQSNLKLLSAEDGDCFPSGSFFVSMDEEKKIVHYQCSNEEAEYGYPK